ncbi:hypothetical protein [Plantactinospora sp. CA-290183]|uniref:hypothetical protein n=1 Tax=Plantactinospora sp. CA-290183 TaxID=3240006 RepID=UPI003D90317B
MPATTRLRPVGAAIAGCLLATAAPAAGAASAAAPSATSAPSATAAPPITVAMTASGSTPPNYQIRVRNDTDGTVKTTVRQDLPPGARVMLVSQGGQAVGGQPGQPGTEIAWQVQLGPRTTALLTSTLGPPGNGADITAPACAYVANGTVPYDCATATWNATNAGAGAGGGTSVRAEPGPSLPWWRRSTVLGALAAVLVLLAAAAYLTWRRRGRRRGAAGRANTGPAGAPAGPRATGDGRTIRRSGNPIARATARVRGNAKIPVPASIRRATGHVPGTAHATREDARPHAGSRAPGDAPAAGNTRAGADAPARDDGLLGDGGLVDDIGTAGPGGLVGIAGGARYVGRAPLPPRTPAPRRQGSAPPDDGSTQATGTQPVVPAVDPSSRFVGRARRLPGVAIRGIRRARPPAWLAVGLASVLAVAVLAGTSWTASTRMSAISSGRQPSSGAWVGRTAAGPVGISLRESAFEFTVYRLTCPPGPQGCRAIVGMRNLTDRSQQWYGTLQRAYLPNGDWVSADVPATQVANAGKDPFADPVPAGQRMIFPLVFAPAGAAAPTRIELRSAVFSAGVSVPVPH